MNWIEFIPQIGANGREYTDIVLNASPALFALLIIILVIVLPASLALIARAVHRRAN